MKDCVIEITNKSNILSHQKVNFRETVLGLVDISWFNQKLHS